MSRPNIALSFRRRVFGMLSTLFRRRWATISQHARRSRLARRLRTFADDLAGATATTSKMVNTHLLTLSQPEFLEARAMMAVTPNLVQTTGPLAVWLTADNDAVYVRQLGDNNGRLQISNRADFGTYIYNSSVPSSLTVYDGADLVVNATPSTGGSGYVTAPAVTVSSTTFSTPISVSTTLTASGINVTSAGTGYAPGDQFVLSQAGIPGAVATVQVTSVSATGVITGTKLTSGGSNFTSFATLALTPSTAAGTGAAITLNGTVSALTATGAAGTGGRFGFGYYRMPQVTIDASPDGS